MRALLVDMLISSVFVFMGGTIGCILFLSERHAKTEEHKYVYSPTYAPTMRTPKRSFAALACAMGFAFSAVAFHQYLYTTYGKSTIPGQVLNVAAPLSDFLLWVAGAIVLGSGVLLLGTTHSLNTDVHDASKPTDLQEGQSQREE